MGWEETVLGGAAYLVVDHLGKTAFVQESLWSSPLCDVGYEEAIEFAEREGLSVDEYYSSPTLLVYGTAERCV